MVKLHTSFGGIVLEREPVKAPTTVKNFHACVESGHSDNTLFHRVIDGFMIQGGSFGPGRQPKPTNAQIRNEADMSPKRA